MLFLWIYFSLPSSHTGKWPGIESNCPLFSSLVRWHVSPLEAHCHTCFPAARRLAGQNKPAYTISHWGDSVCWGNGNMRSAISPSGSRCQFHANLSQRKEDCLLVHPQKWASWSLYSKALENQSPCRVIDDQKHKCKVLITCTITGTNLTLLVKSFTHGPDFCDASLYFDVVSGSVLWDLTSTAEETMWKGLEGGTY